MNSPDIETVEPIDTVSIIVPSLNEEPFIKKCLSSIRGQSIIQEYSQYFELILCDSCSTDDTVKIAEQYADKIINVPIRGKSTARNLAVKYQKEGKSIENDEVYIGKYEHNGNRKNKLGKMNSCMSCGNKPIVGSKNLCADGTKSPHIVSRSACID